MVAKADVTLEMTPSRLQSLNVDQVLGTLRGIRNLVVDSKESKGFLGLFRCGGTSLPRGSFHVDLDQGENDAATE